METDKERLERLERESQKEATDRISKELRAETKQIEREKVFMNYFFDLTGVPMSMDWLKEYLSIFDNVDTPRGYNLKNFIESKKEQIEKLKKILNENETKIQ